MLLLLMVACIGCQWQMRPSDDEEELSDMTIERYDRVETTYLTLADFAALRQMNTDYPTETRMLIEDVLHLGPATAPDINTRLLVYFQDTTLQALISDVEREFENMDDLNSQLNDAFNRLHSMLPDTVNVPRVYAQIGSLDQSVIVGKGVLGISLDKYLGADYPLYLRFGYTEEQRAMMTRRYIVPDCIAFYVLSLFPEPQSHTTDEHFRHIGRVQYIVNMALGSTFFSGEHVDQARRDMESGRYSSYEEFMTRI